MAERMKLGTTDLIDRLRRDPLALYRHAYDDGMNMSQWLKRHSSVGEKDDDGLDPFDRIQREVGVVTRSDPVAGYWASEAAFFFDTQIGRALAHEFVARQWRKVSYATPEEQRAIYLSTDGTPGSWQRPYAEAQMARWDEIITPQIPLAALIAITTPIEGQDYRSFYLEHSAEEVRQFRLGESAEIPIAKLTDHENVIQLKKYVRGLRASYEQMRRMRVDKFALHIQRVASQSEIDKVSTVVDISINGDGNSNTAATTYDLTTLDTGASAGTLTLKGWLAFKMKFANPYILDTALMREAVALDLQLLNTGSANVPLVAISGEGFIGGLRPINRFADNVGFGWLDDVPALQILGMDTRQAIERVVEIGGDITETERFITNQTSVITMTEVEGYAVLDQNASNLLDVDA
jgi:hypothetical protein